MPIVFQAGFVNGGDFAVADWPTPDRRHIARANNGFVAPVSMALFGTWRAYTGSWSLPLFTDSGDFEEASTFSGEWKLPLFTDSGTFISDNNYSGEFRLPLFERTIEHALGSAFSAIWTLPLFTGTGTFGNFQYTGAWVLPLFVPDGRTEAPVTQVFAAWPLNLKNLGLTEYTNYSFNSLTRFNGEYLAAGPNGLTALGGDTDNGTAIDARIRFRLDDMNSDQLKRLEETFITYRSAGDLTLRVIIDHGQTYEYTLTATGNTGMATNRAKIGKGIESNYYCLEIENVNGTDFDLQQLSTLPVILSRKIGRPPSTGTFTGRMFLPMFTGSGSF